MQNVLVNYNVMLYPLDYEKVNQYLKDQSLIAPSDKVSVEEIWVASPPGVKPSIKMTRFLIEKGGADVLLIGKSQTLTRTEGRVMNREVESGEKKIETSEEFTENINREFPNMKIILVDTAMFAGDKEREFDL